MHSGIDGLARLLRGVDDSAWTNAHTDIGQLVVDKATL